MLKVYPCSSWRLTSAKCCGSNASAASGAPEAVADQDDHADILRMKVPSGRRTQPVVFLPWSPPSRRPPPTTSPRPTLPLLEAARAAVQRNAF